MKEQNRLLSDRDREAELGVTDKVDDEDRKERHAAALRALRNRRSRPGRNIYKPMRAMNLAPVAMKSMGTPERNYEALNLQERDTIKTSLKGCVKKRTKVWVVINPKGGAKLAKGQLMDTAVVPCLASKLNQIAFFDGKWRKGSVTLP